MTRAFSHYRPLAIAIWLLAVSSSLAWNSVDNIREQNAIALETARAFFAQIMASRRWNLMYGGVYVYTTEQAPLNPYLPKDKQSIRDENGRSLTLITPASMTKQISAINQPEGQIHFHITSLTPLGEANAPYPWEIPWLQSFKRGVKEQSSFIKEKEGKIFRYMAPLTFNKSCLPCHSALDQHEGSIRGAISVSLPIRFNKSPWPLIISHLFVALIGMGGIFFFGGRLAQSRRNILTTNRQLQQEVEERKQTEKELLTIKDNLETLINDRTSELRQTNETLDARIKEQQRIEASLVAIKEEFVQIFNSAPDGMHIIDRHFNVIRANKAFCRLTGKSIEEIQGHKCYEALAGKLCHTQQCPLTEIMGGAERVEVEGRKTCYDGQSIPCIVTATPFREPGGNIIGIIEVTRDISNWKEIEESLSSTAKHLQVRNQELEDFTHVISHDLQEPLMLIKAFSERIRNKCSTALPEQGKTYLERIESSTSRMQNLIDGLLLYSRVDSKANPFESLNLNTIINSVLDDLALRIEKSKATITVEDNLGAIEAEPLQMRQLFQNIIGNSLKYHHQERSPEIIIKRLPFPDTLNNQNFIRISIRDNGIGFDPKFQELIFDIFQRLHTRQQFQGTGIGLSICKKIVDRHQGTITAKGIPDKGAEFIITLPPVQRNAHQKERSRDNSLIDIIMNRR
ncbi:MAG: DUF3365 domain-containing protein [Proteobacteria bacterium]|nr:DUF3365 domain-containing protein [Pseudomonadota bacterium]MBU1417612.1 DUF3365 domain-containing protein [Pseudomonadota bacterium]MBU1456429.1 DUF3365 domain-containing protein [Pseudomonadota bacterium]